MTDKPATTWRKSSCSADNDQCVEVLGTLDAVRDSKNPDQELRFKHHGQVPQLIQFLRSHP
jgi:hypothetical protein